MRIAIAGGTGTLGRHVATELTGRGHDVRVLSRSSAQYRVDLSTGEGLAAALAGCDVLVDASNSQSAKGAAKVLAEGSRRLIEAEQAAGVRHHVCISIVGIEQLPVGYYKVKLMQEAVVHQGDVPWSIVRATQFHELAAAAFGAAAKYRLLPGLRFSVQTIAAADVAKAVADVAEGAPLGGRTDVAGPEVCQVRELAAAWRAATGRSAMLVSVPLPGKIGRALRAGALTAPESAVPGGTTFADWLKTSG
jgi:uncharacterized protein YbjT (DUF2867 family)